MSNHEASPRYISGVLTSTWSDMKVARAAELWRHLEGRLEVWTSSLAVYLEIEQASRDTLKWVVRGRSQPPVEEWSLFFGDIVHNLRSALDALIYEICMLADPAPTDSEQRQIYFPAEHDSTKWDSKWVPKLRFLNSDVLERVKKFQPFAQEDPDESFIHHLHAIDITDKHRGQIYVGVNPARILGESVQIALAEKIPEGQEIKHELFEVPFDLSEGTVVAVTTVPNAIVDFDLVVVDRQPIRVWLTQNGAPVEVGAWVPELIAETKAVLAFIRQGFPAMPPGSVDIIEPTDGEG